MIEQTGTLEVPHDGTFEEWGPLLGALSTAALCSQLSTRPGLTPARLREVSRAVAQQVTAVAMAFAEIEPTHDGLTVADLRAACHRLVADCLVAVLGERRPEERN